MRRSWSVAAFALPLEKGAAATPRRSVQMSNCTEGAERCQLWATAPCPVTRPYRPSLAPSRAWESATAVERQRNRPRSPASKDIQKTAETVY